MRTPHNETLIDPSTKEAADDPVRRCILSGDRAPRDRLIRLAIGPDGAVLPDVRAKAPGRGAWIGVTLAELETAMAKGRLNAALARAFKSNAAVPAPDLPRRIADALERAVLDRLGMLARAGHALTGGERIEKAARRGGLALLLHAADAGVDGNRRLDQAWRVGRDVEGSDLKGLVLPVARSILSMALGRENVVHVGITDPAAGARLREAIDRWLHFIGPVPGDAACETVSQGASALTDRTAGQPGGI